MQSLCNPDEDIYEIEIDGNAARGLFSVFANIQTSICCFFLCKELAVCIPSIADCDTVIVSEAVMDALSGGCLLETHGGCMEAI